jgi:DNA-binding beta-propeller fold protein YncE
MVTSRRLVALAALGGIASLSIATAGLAQNPVPEILAVGLDRKFAYDEQGRRQALEPGRDEVAFYDLKDPAEPRLIGILSLENSIVGPPTNLAVTPDQRLALVASALKSEKGADGAWKSVPSDELHVVDLVARPPKLIRTIKVGSQPSGLSIDPTGRFALVANRDGKSISVLKIDGQDVTVTSTVPLGDSVTSVAITPDGKRALATKFAAHKVAMLSIGADGKVTYDGRDLPVGLFPWTITVSPDGTRALVTNIGANAASDGNAKTISVIDLKRDPVRVVQYVSVGDAPEGVSFSPDGKQAAVTVLQGSYDAPRGSWWRNEVGLLTLLRVAADGVSVGASTTVGAFPEGVAFSADSRFVYVGNFASSTLSILAVDADGRVTSQKTKDLPGPPAALRIGSR